jgi:glycoprotein endo-alpha-1,2-mannosidase
MAQIVKSPISIGLVTLVLILAGVVGFLASRQPEQATITTTSFIQLPQITTRLTIVETFSEKVTETKTVSLTKTSLLVRTETTTERGIIILHISAKPYLKKEEGRWIWFKIMIRAMLGDGRTIEGLRMVIDDVGEAIMRGQDTVELEGYKAGVHHIKLQWEDWSWEGEFKIGFPDIDPDIFYASLVSGDREDAVKFVAAYYGWYGVGNLKWAHWGNPEKPETKYFPLLGQVSGDPASQSYSLYGFSLDEEMDLRLVKRQMVLAKMAGISTFAISWWGPNSFEDRFMPIIMKAAEEVGFKVTVIFEPFYTGSADKWSRIEESVKYLESRYMNSHVWLRDSHGQPVVFTFDIGPREEWDGWKKVLSGKNMAWVAHTTDRSILDYGFKYFYEYSPVGILAAGKDMMKVYMGVSDKTPYDMLFIPTVSPRYDDTKIRTPGYKIDEELWETTVKATKEVLALRRPQFVFVTSWNEWHESTSIEPDTINGFKFLIEFRREFYNEEFSEKDFLNTLRVLDCLDLCEILII